MIHNHLNSLDSAYCDRYAMKLLASMYICSYIYKNYKPCRISYNWISGTMVLNYLYKCTTIKLVSGRNG